MTYRIAIACTVLMLALAGCGDSKNSSGDEDVYSPVTGASGDLTSSTSSSGDDDSGSDSNDKGSKGSKGSSKDDDPNGGKKNGDEPPEPGSVKLTIPKRWPSDPVAAVKATYRLAWKSIYHGQGDIACKLMTKDYQLTVLDKLLDSDIQKDTCGATINQAADVFRIGLDDDGVQISDLEVKGNDATFKSTPHAHEQKVSTFISMKKVKGVWLISAEDDRKRR